MNIIKFQCKKCGTCCRNLMEDRNYIDIHNGMFLTAREIRLFQRKLISPHFAIGKNKPRHIISYQLNVTVCPHLTEKNKCRIYDKRPLTCKAFPLEVISAELTLSLKCPIVNSHMKDKVRAPWKLLTTEIDAVQRSRKYISNRCQKYGKASSKLWDFDLRTKSWKVVK